MVGEVHRVTERRVQSLDDEVGLALVLEADEELDDVAGGKLDGPRGQVLSRQLSFVNQVKTDRLNFATNKWSILYKCEPSYPGP